MKEFDINTIIGKTKEEAKEIINNHGYKFRITSENDINYIITTDFRSDRINVDLKNNIVINFDIF